jgi:hypothetical protein
MAAALLGEPMVARRTGDGGERRLTGTETAARRDGDGRAASGMRRRRTRASAASDRGGRDCGASEASDRGDGGVREAVGRWAARARRLSGARGAWRLTGGARSSVISE